MCIVIYIIYVHDDVDVSVNEYVTVCVYDNGCVYRYLYTYTFTYSYAHTSTSSCT